MLETIERGLTFQVLQNCPAQKYIALKWIVAAGYAENLSRDTLKRSWSDGFVLLSVRRTPAMSMWLQQLSWKSLDWQRLKVGFKIWNSRTVQTECGQITNCARDLRYQDAPVTNELRELIWTAKSLEASDDKLPEGSFHRGLNLRISVPNTVKCSIARENHRE